MHVDATRNPDAAPLEADHSKPIKSHGHINNRADRLLHRACNRSRGDGSRDHLRPALTGNTTPNAAPAGDSGLGTRIMPWPTRPAR